MADLSIETVFATKARLAELLALPLIGRRGGQRVLRFGDRIEVVDLPKLAGERCASVGGVSLHANVAVPPRDRRRLEQLCRYVARPPLATGRLSRLADGRLLYRLKHRWRDGTTHVVFEPHELMEKLAALIPPPRFHGARYHGVLAPNARRRASVVPTNGTPDTAPETRERADEGGVDAARPAPSVRDERATSPETPVGELNAPSSVQPLMAGSSREAPTSVPNPAPAAALPRPRRLAWAELLKRVFAVDVLECPRCGERTRVLTASLPPDATRAILECLGLPSRAPPVIAAGPRDSTDYDAPADN